MLDDERNDKTGRVVPESLKKTALYIVSKFYELVKLHRTVNAITPTET